MNKSLSVIIPSYNRVSSLTRAIQSVIDQNTADTDLGLQIIVVDDGSTDDTQKVIQSQFPQVNYHYQVNQGVSAARNQGLKLAKNEWIALLDSDDEWRANKIQQQFELLEQSDLLVCHTDEIWIRNGVRVNQMKKHAKQGGWIFQQCLPLCAMSPSSIIIHKSVFDRVGLFDEALPACEDYDLWLRITANYEVAFLDKAMINKFGGHADQLSRQYWGMDRFRVLALEKILNTKLSKENYQAAHKILLKKLCILKQGALKHNNQPLLADCANKLNNWRNDIDYT